MNKITIVYGTRPEYIKLKPVIDELKKSEEIKLNIVKVMQHTDLITDTESDQTINITQYTGNRLNDITMSILHDLDLSDTRLLIVQGDTTTGMAAAMCAFHNEIEVLHIEALLRSNCIKNPYPEEFNRCVIDLVSDYLTIIPKSLNTPYYKIPALGERQIIASINTAYDDLKKYRTFVPEEEFVLITFHRRENKKYLSKWFDMLSNLMQKDPTRQFIMVKHPSITNEKYQLLATNNNLKLIDPIPRDQMIDMIKRAKLVITDSGGVHEECVYFNKAFICLRVRNERYNLCSKRIEYYNGSYYIRNNNTNYWGPITKDSLLKDYTNKIATTHTGSYYKPYKDKVSTIRTYIENKILKVED